LFIFRIPRRVDHRVNGKLDFAEQLVGSMDAGVREALVEEQERAGGRITGGDVCVKKAGRAVREPAL
jgi:hypothetical protein